MGDGEQSTDATNAAQSLSEADVLRCIPGLRALLFRLTRNLDTTNDLSQETVIAVILAVRAGQVREPAALAAYLHRVARNKVKALVNSPQLTLVEDVPDVPLWGERPLTPLEHFEAGELRVLALEVLDELSAQRDRDLIVAYYVDGLNKAELMQKLDLRSDHFDRVIWRARKRMRDRLLAKLNGQTTTLRALPPGQHLPGKDQKVL